MASIYGSGGSFDTQALEKELTNALEQDRKHKLTDEMKKRAITKASSYEEFKNFVACADLTPLSQKELKEMHTSQRSQLRARYQPSTSNLSPLNETKEFELMTPTKPPRTSNAFCKNWRRHCGTKKEKYRYLDLTGATRLKKLFQTEMESDLMADIVNVLLTDWKQEQSWTKASFIVAILHTLPQLGRFSLNVAFFSEAEKQTTRTLLSFVREYVADNTKTEQPEEPEFTATLDEIAQAFGF